MSLQDLYIEGIQTVLGPNFKFETKNDIGKCFNEKPTSVIWF